ncbi:MAG: hypothetical protein JXR77_16575 [Lentisphaeria bacterium]|nr:hypothetical protein [Lentisphaeria bacterium]
MLRVLTGVWQAGLAATLLGLGVRSLPAAEDGVPVAVTESFDGGLASWTLHPPDLWEVRDGALVLTKPGPQTPPVRRPGAYALLRDRVWRDVTIEARIQSLRPASVKGRDLCIVFGYRDETHFYYAHLSNDSNGKTHNVIVKVMGSARVPITNEKRPEARLSDGWHDVRVEHRADGDIRVFMDDNTDPLMSARDTDYTRGAVGVGTFDDPGMFDDVRVTGSLVSGPPPTDAGGTAAAPEP